MLIFGSQSKSAPKEEPAEVKAPVPTPPLELENPGNPAEIDELFNNPGAALKARPKTPSRIVCDTVIAQNITIFGTIKGDGAIRIEGTVEGEIELSGSVLVTPTGLVKGPVSANRVCVSGRIEGSVTAKEYIELGADGSIEGDVTTVSLVVEGGGTLNGRSTMLRPEPPKQEKLPAPKKPANAPASEQEKADTPPEASPAPRQP